VFTGQEHDENTKLIYFGARYYDPDSARFLNQDSYLGEINTPPSLHRYLYAYANPLVYLDRDGHLALDPLEDSLRQGAQDAITDGIATQQSMDNQRNTALIDPFDPNAKPFAEMAGYQAAGYDILADVVGVVDFGLNVAGILANKVGLVSDEVAAEMTKENEEGVQKLVGETVTSALNFKQTANEINQLRQDAKAGDEQAIAALARLKGNIAGSTAIGVLTGGPGTGAGRGVARGVNRGLRNAGRQAFAPNRLNKSSGYVGTGNPRYDELVSGSTSMSRFTKDVEAAGIEVITDSKLLAKAAQDHGPFQAMFDWDAKKFYYNPDNFTKEVFVHEQLHFMKYNRGYQPQAGLLGDSFDEVRVYGFMKRLGQKNNFSASRMKHYDDLLNLYRTDVEVTEASRRLQDALDSFWD
jgi:RHS repeat-associated protein